MAARVCIDRRRFVVGGVSSLVLLPRLSISQPASQLDVVEVAKNVRVVSGAGGNVVVLEGSDGIVMVDGGSAEHSPSLLELVRGNGRPVLAHFNTHWHYDHTGSNAALRSGGAPIFAHENTKLWLGGEFYVEREDRNYGPRPPEALPTETFYTAGEMALAGEDIEFGYLPRAHTDGDIYVYFRRANVLVVGDTVSVGQYPVSDYSTGGWPVGVMDACDILLDLADADTRIVPGHGPVVARAHVQSERDMLASVTERMMEMMSMGMSAAEMLAAGATKDFDADWGDPRLFVTNGYKGLWAHVFALSPRPI